MNDMTADVMSAVPTLSLLPVVMTAPVAVGRDAIKASTLVPSGGELRLQGVTEPVAGSVVEYGTEVPVLRRRSAISFPPAGIPFREPPV
ncbi:hypothetical protein ACFFKU_04985 [Kineococcus gynurae]|uniref:Secreted protein n=1 Tax=Kineococcus gynurae TaxID=452979 RepID=A0ABV5LN51_9ACTN